MRCLAQLRVLAQLQSVRIPAPLPALAAWLAARAGPVLATWRNRERRAAVAERLQALAKAGYLAPMLQVLDDPVARSADAREAGEAAAGAGPHRCGTGADRQRLPQRAAMARRLGQEIAAGLGLTALATALAVAALG